MSKATDAADLTLSNREVLILSLRHFMNPPANYGYIGGLLGVSAEFVRHLDAKLASRVRVAGGKFMPIKWEEIQ